MATVSVPEGHKPCGRCKTVLLLEAFGSNRSCKDGKNVWCNACLRVYETVRRSDPDFRALLAERTRKRRERPEVRAREKIARAAYQESNSEKIKSYARTEKYRAHYRERIKTPEGRENNRVVQANRRARERYNGGHVSRAEWEQIKADFGHSCAYCLALGVSLEMDHIQPLKAGGVHLASNAVPACVNCNRTKNRKDLIQFLAYSTGVAI